MPSRFAAAFLLALIVPLRAISAEDEPLLLKLDHTFNVLPTTDASPASITAQHMEGKKGGQLEATGNAELHKDGRAIYADHLLYQQDTQQVQADGAVRIVERDGSSVAGPHLEFDLHDDTGQMKQPEYQLSANNSHGRADELRIAGRQNYTLYGATYTTCPADREDWHLHVGELDIDRGANVGVAHDSWVDFKGVPIMYSPWMDFPLSGGRKTGFLGPTIGSTTTGGGELTLPFYWNMAPNYDATITPRYMVRRGTLIGNQFRYLEPSFRGEINLDALPQDKLTQNSRIHEAFKHEQVLGGGFSAALNLNRVSDDAYFRDISTTAAGTSQVNLLREGSLVYNGGWWNGLARVQSYQTLQDPLMPIVTPYRRAPQLLVNAQQVFDGQVKAAFTGEYVDFTHPTLLNGRRVVAYPTVSYPLVSDPGYFLTPKVGLHTTWYSGLGGNNIVPAQTNVSRIVPISSIDSGMMLERDVAAGERHFVHTVEPRAYYVYIPYRQQDALPIFDTAQMPFSFAQMFTENRFAGNDRVGDANQLTLSLTTRLLDADDGIERLKLMIGERFNFKTPKVYLVAPATVTSKSDVLLGASGRLTNALSLNGLLQYNPTQSFTEMYNYSLRYKPEAGKVFNLTYRFAHPNLIAGPSMRQIDISEQWPLFGRWGTVARWNYSLLDKRLLEGLAGVEYLQTCWSLQMVGQRITTATNQASTGFFVILNLNGLVGLGADPLEPLRRSIPGYTRTDIQPSSDITQGLQ